MENQKSTDFYYDLGLSLKDLAELAAKDGFSIKPRTLQKYIGMGLMPAPEKEGGYGQGVRLVYLDGDAAYDRLKKILSLKAKKYSLAEISKILKTQEISLFIQKNRKQMESHIKRDGCYYHLLDEEVAMRRGYTGEPINIPAKSVFEFITKLSAMELGPENNIKVTPVRAQPDDLQEIDNRRLFVPTDFFRDSPVFNTNNLTIDGEISSWCVLNDEYGVDWNTLEALHNVHKANLEKYVPLPEPDGKRFTPEWVGWRRQLQFNRFAKMLTSYLERMKTNFIKPGDQYWPDGSAFWDSAYSSHFELITDFLDGNCAFFRTAMYESTGHYGYFLRRFT